MSFEELILGRRPVQHKVNCACDSTTMQPSIRIDPEGLATELFQMAWLLNRFEKTMET